MTLLREVFEAGVTTGVRLSVALASVFGTRTVGGTVLSARVRFESDSAEESARVVNLEHFELRSGFKNTNVNSPPSTESGLQNLSVEQ